MKLTVIIIFIILSIWAIFSFETEKLYLFSRYVWSNFKVFPLRSSLVLLVTLILTISLYFWIQKFIYEPIKSQTKSIEPIFGEFTERNINVDTLEITEQYLKLHNRLSANFSDQPLKTQLREFIKSSRILHLNIPSPFSSFENGFNNQVFNFTSKTQISALQIKKFKHTILFISHNENRPDCDIKTFEFEDLPDNVKLHEIIDPIFNDETLDYVRTTFNSWINDNGFQIHGSANLAAATSQKLNGEWLWIGVPEPFNKQNNLNQILSETVLLQTLEKN